MSTPLTEHQLRMLALPTDAPTFFGMSCPTCQDPRFLAACDIMRAQDRLLRSIDATQPPAEDSKATPRAISASPGRAFAVTGPSGRGARKSPAAVGGTE